MRFLSFLAALLTSACCTSLPRTSVKQSEVPEMPAGAQAIAEREEVFRDVQRQRDVPVKMYIPAGPGPWPVAVVSHGIGEDRNAYAYLGRALAVHGFLAVHITHAGTDRAVLEQGYLALYRATKQRVNWVNRPLDVSFVLDQMESRADADLARVAVIGHSAGAFTAFAVAGLRSSSGEELRDPRVDLIIPMSMPYLGSVVPEGGYDGIAIPVLNITGTCDTSLIYRTLPRHRRIPYERSTARRQYLATIEGVRHESFSNVRDPFHEVITELVLLFLRAHLQEDPRAEEWFAASGRSLVSGKSVVLESRP